MSSPTTWPFAHHHDPVGQDRQFLDIGRNDDDADAAPRQFTNGLVDLFARADIDAAGGLVEDQDFGVRPQPSRDQRLLLVASRKARDLARRARRFDPKVLDQAASLISHLLGRKEGQNIYYPQRLQRRDVDVEGDRLREHQALRATLLRHERDAKLNRLGFAADRHALSVHFEMAALKAVNPKSQTGDFGAAGSDKATEREDLTSVDIETDPFDRRAASDIKGREQWDAASVRLDPTAAFHAFYVMADNRADQSLLVQAAARGAPDDLTIAEDGNAIAEVQHLIEPMRDIEDRDAARREVAYDRKQLLAFRTRQRSSWLVHRDQGGFTNEGFADHDEPALANRQVRDFRVEWELDAHSFRGHPRGPARALPVNQAETRRLGRAKEHILKGAEVGNQIEFLMDKGQSGLFRRLRRA